MRINLNLLGQEVRKRLNFVGQFYSEWSLNLPHRDLWAWKPNKGRQYQNSLRFDYLVLRSQVPWTQNGWIPWFNQLYKDPSKKIMLLHAISLKSLYFKITTFSKQISQFSRQISNDNSNSCSYLNFSQGYE